MSCHSDAFAYCHSERSEESTYAQDKGSGVVGFARLHPPYYCSSSSISKWSAS